MKYQIIYADPPWNYKDIPFDRDPAPYETMTPDQIARLSIDNIADWNCALFLWAVFPHLQEALYVMRAWGFEYRTVAFVWIKLNKNSKTPFFGMGQWTRANAEICLMGMRGKLARKDASISQVVTSVIGEHSRKPPIVRDKIVQLLGNLPRIELFAREDLPMFPKPDGWDVWGKQIESALEPDLLKDLSVDEIR